jgi:hypothetical protein
VMGERLAAGPFREGRFPRWYGARQWIARAHWHERSAGRRSPRTPPPRGRVRPARNPASGPAAGQHALQHTTHDKPSGLSEEQRP